MDEIETYMGLFLSGSPCQENYGSIAIIWQDIFYLRANNEEELKDKKMIWEWCNLKNFR